MRVGKVLHTHSHTHTHSEWQWQCAAGGKDFHAHRVCVCCTWMLQANYAGIDTPNAAVARSSSSSSSQFQLQLQVWLQFQLRAAGRRCHRAAAMAAVADSRPIKTRIRKVAIARSQDLKSERETFYKIHADFRCADQRFEQRSGAVYLNHQEFVSVCETLLFRG